MTPGPDRFRLRLRLRWWGVLLAAAGCGAGIALGNWQSGRAEEKRAAGAAMQPVALRGEFLAKFAVFLDNKVYRGQAGYQLVQAFRTVDGKNILVNRGWTAAAPRREQLPVVRTPSGELKLEGLRLARLPHAYEPGPAQRPAGAVWQNVTVEAFAAWSGLALEPWVLEQHSASDDGLVRDWPARGAGADKHEMYALQWYSLAALSVMLLLALSVAREKRGP